MQSNGYKYLGQTSSTDFLYEKKLNKIVFLNNEKFHKKINSKGIH